MGGHRRFYIGSFCLLSDYFENLFNYINFNIVNILNCLQSVFEFLFAEYTGEVFCLYQTNHR